MRAPEQLMPWVNAIPAHWVLSTGVIDGRNIWRNDLAKTLQLLAAPAQRLGQRLWLAPSCSFLHTPATLAHEVKLDAEIKSWLAFADEKLTELQILTKALNEGEAAVADELTKACTAIASRNNSNRVHDDVVKARIAALDSINENRASNFQTRTQAQKIRLNLPLLPTTTIGSFPQTADIRASRAAFKKGEIDQTRYDLDMESHIAYAIAQQEEVGLDGFV